MRYLLLAVLCLFSNVAHVTTYDVNMFGPLPDGITAGPEGGVLLSACGPTSCAARGPAFSFYATPGDVIDFGTLTFGGPFTFSDGRNSEYTEYLGDDGFLHTAFGPIVQLYGGSVVERSIYFELTNVDPNLIAQCNSANPNCATQLSAIIAAYVPTPFELLYTVPNTGFIEIGWVDVTNYTAPAYVGAVPEPSTWAMMLLGFAALGIVRFYRQPLRRIGRLENVLQHSPRVQP